MTRFRRRALTARRRRRQANRHPLPAGRAPGPPRSRGARARRGRHLELHRRRGSRAVRRGAACPRQSDQRGDEAYASVADSRAWPRPRVATPIAARPASACSRSAAATSPMPSGRPSACCWPATGEPRSWQSGKAKGFDAFDAKAEALALLEAAGAPVGNLQLSMGAGDTWHPGRSATLGLGKECPRRLRRASSARCQGTGCACRNGRGGNLSRRHPRSAHQRARAFRLYAAGVAGGDPRLRLHRPG